MTSAGTVARAGDDVVLREREVPNSRHHALSHRRVGGHRLPELGQVGNRLAVTPGRHLARREPMRQLGGGGIGAVGVIT